MTNLEDVVPIIYPPGHFGHYLHWVLDNFTELGRQQNKGLPFDEFGGSHNSGERHIIWDDFVKKKNYKPFVIVHLLKNDQDQLEQITSSVKHCIIVNASINRLQSYNMIYEKRWKNDIQNFLQMLAYNCKIPKLDRFYEYRELCSYKLFHNINWASTDKENVLSINLDNLLYNFLDTFKNISKFLDTKIISPEESVKNHNAMLILQRHLSKDKDITTFLECFKNNIDCKLPKYSTIIDEAYIQHYLRDELNLEIKCFELETFPTTTTELRKITYPAKELKRFE